VQVKKTLVFRAAQIESFETWFVARFSVAVGAVLAMRRCRSSCACWPMRSVSSNSHAASIDDTRRRVEIFLRHSIAVESLAVVVCVLRVHVSDVDLLIDNSMTLQLFVGVHYSFFSPRSFVVWVLFFFWLVIFVCAFAHSRSPFFFFFRLACQEG
jgi:hypothetical protein